MDKLAEQLKGAKISAKLLTKEQVERLAQQHGYARVRFFDGNTVGDCMFDPMRFNVSHDEHGNILRVWEG